MRKTVKVCAGGLAGLLVLGGCEPAWVYAAAEDSGVVGEADVGPTCPAVRIGQVCPPGHTAVTGYVIRRGWPGVAALIHTGPQGRFRLRLAPGQYTIHVLQSPWRPSLPALARSTIPVRVRPHAYTPVTIDFDSGIR